MAKVCCKLDFLFFAAGDAVEVAGRVEETDIGFVVESSRGFVEVEVSKATVSSFWLLSGTKRYTRTVQDTITATTAIRMLTLGMFCLRNSAVNCFRYNNGALNLHALNISPKRVAFRVYTLPVADAHAHIWRQGSDSILGTTRTDTRAPMLMYWADLSRIVSPQE